MRSLAVVLKNYGGDVSDAYLGIDVSKDTLDTDCASGRGRQSRSFANGPEGWRQLLAWLKAVDVQQAHVCLEATGRYSLGVALALQEAGHRVSIVNPAQIPDFARTKLGRNKTDAIDAALIREYGELFKPVPACCTDGRDGVGRGLFLQGLRMKTASKKRQHIVIVPGSFLATSPHADAC